jgi:serine/threonine protein kinase
MGQKQPAAQQAEPACVIDHPRFKQARLLTDKTGESIQISVPVVSEGELVAWEKGFRALLAHDSLLLPLSFEFKRTELCGANGLCKVKFDNYPFLLRDEISSRRTQPGKPFENEELWYLALSLLEAGHAMHGRGEKVGDVQPGNVFINDNGQAKVACQYSWPHELDNYQKTVFEKEITFLAPEEVRDLHFGLTGSKTDLALAESFSIGLTLLDSALLTDSTDLYSLSAFRIDYQKLEQRRGALGVATNLDEVLRQAVLGLTEVDPKARLNCSVVFEWMDKYRESIVNMEGFEIRELPSWIKPQLGERRSVQMLKPPTQPPFYV